ncbi:MAG: hypothetical protein AB7Q27_10360 [Acidimicrobiia bacterium]
MTAICVTALSAFVMLPRPAAADTAGAAVTDRGDIESGAEVNVGQPGHTGSSRPTCIYTNLDIPDGLPVYDESGQLIQTDGTGDWYEKTCDGVFQGAIYISRRAPTALLDQARELLPLPLPEPRLNPAGDQIVNLSTWMWLAAGWSSQDSSVSVPGITVAVHAEPISATWTMGDGAVVVCDGPGTAFNAALPTAAQAPTCTHVYARSSASQPSQTYSMAVTVRWRATWSVSGFAGGGDLGTIDRTTAFTVRVGEVEAVNTRTS